MRALLDGITPGTVFVDLTEEDVYGCLVAVDHDRDTGPDRIAMLPEYEDGSDPRWKILHAALSTARLALDLHAVLAAAEARERGLREVLERVQKRCGQGADRNAYAALRAIRLEVTAALESRS